jgi:hypothetical protein
MTQEADRRPDGTFSPGKSGNPKGTFTPGKSGNPKGRPTNAHRIRELLEPHQEALIVKAIALALAGDTKALRLCIERLAPPPRPESAAVVIPELEQARNLSDKAAAVLNAVARGEVTPDVGERLLSTLASYAKAVEVDELAKRIALLEAKDLL